MEIANISSKLWKNVGHILELTNTARVVNFLSNFVFLALILFIEWNFWPEREAEIFVLEKRADNTKDKTWRPSRRYIDLKC